MRVVFATIGAEQLGVEMLSAVLRREGFDVRLAFSAGLFNDRYNLHVPALSKLFSEDEAVLRGIVSLDPDVLCLSPLTPTYGWCLEVAREARRRLPRLKVLAGGVHASAVPDRVISEGCIDAVCIGEGENAIRAYLRAIGRGGPSRPIMNVWFKGRRDRVVKGRIAPFIQDLDSLPFPDKELFEDHFDMSECYCCLSGRGCPYKCAFCFNSFWASLPGKNAGRYVRRRSPENLIAELKWALGRYGFREVEFLDDVFTLDRRWLGKFLDLYGSEIRRPFSCMSHVSNIDDETARLLAEAGCAYVQLGIQSADQERREVLLRRREDDRSIEQALETLGRNGVRFTLDHMLGLPGEPEEARQKALRLYTRHRPMRVNTFWLTLYPGTAIARQAMKSGAVSEDAIEAIGRGGAASYHLPPGDDPARVKELLRHEAVLKSIPLLGDKLGGILTGKAAALAPRLLLISAGLLADAASAVYSGYPDARRYARHYMRHIARRITFWRKTRVHGTPSRRNPTLSTRLEKG